MNKDRPHRDAPNLAPEILHRLGYSSRASGRWWHRDRTIIPAIVVVLIGFVLVMGSLLVMESARQDTPALSGGVGSAQGVSQAIRQTRTSFSRVDEALLRVLPTDLEIPVPASSVEEGAADPIEQESAPTVSPGAVGGGATYWFGIEATSPGVHGYEGVFAMAPGRST